MLRFWNINRAAGAGIVLGLFTLILWLLFASYQEPFRLPYMAGLAATAFCGLSILWMTAADLMLHSRRSRKLMPLRAFDVALGTLLSVPTIVTLRSLLS